jgi:hypothetical protein
MPSALGGLEVDDQIVFGRRLHCQVTRFFAAEKAIHLLGCTPVLVDDVGAV